jgi:hypothetical protein
LSKKGRNTQTAVEKLVEQRRLIHDWLAKLRANVDGMPSHVIERVRNDYRTRLDSVMAELASHRDSLREALEEAQKRHEELDDLAQHKKDELTELKLRRQVGEMDDPDFKDQNSEMQSTIEQIKKDLTATIRDIEKYEEILEVITAGESPAARDEDSGHDEDEAEKKPSKKSEKSKGTAAAKPVDELAFLKSVTSMVNAVKLPPPAPPEPRKEPAKAAEAPVTIDAAPGLITLPGGSEPRAPAKPREAGGLIVVTGNEDAAKAMEPPAPPPPPPPPPPKPGTGGAAAVVPSGVPQASASRVDPSIAQSGVRCKQCGAVNRPTEWYCEKCGAELAAF